MADSPLPNTSNAQMAAVDKLRYTIETAANAIDIQVDATLDETLAFLEDAKKVLESLAGRIDQAQKRIGDARARWQGQRPIADTPAKPPAPPSSPPPAFLQPGNSGKSGLDSQTRQ